MHVCVRVQARVLFKWYLVRRARPRIYGASLFVFDLGRTVCADLFGKVQPRVPTRECTQPFGGSVFYTLLGVLYKDASLLFSMRSFRCVLEALKTKFPLCKLSEE